MQYQIFIITLGFILMDILFGVTKAAVNKELSSTKMREGLMHKMAFIGAVAVATLFEYAMGYLDFGFTAPIVVPTCVYVCATELVSIIENLGDMNPALKATAFLKLFNIESGE